MMTNDELDKPSMTHLVVDLETLGTSDNAFVTAIGWSAFRAHPNGDVSMTNHGVIGIDIRQPQPGAVIDGDTVHWWLGQGEHARDAMCSGPHTPEVAARRIASLCRELSDLNEENFRIWGNGPTFDLTILRNFIKRHGEYTPWGFRQERCIRTICEAAGVRWKDHLDPGKAHDPEEDAKAEAMGLRRALLALGQA